MDGGWRTAVALHAESQPGFGGIFVDGGKMVVLFTDELDQHRRELRRLLPRRARVAVRQCNRTYADMECIQERVGRHLFGRDDPHVTEIGLDLHGDDVAVVVTVYPYSDAAAQRSRELASPDSIVIVPGGGLPLPA